MHLYQHLGWAYLAKCKGVKDKVATFKNALVRLECSLDHAMTTTVDPDTRNDLRIMKDNLAILQTAAKRLL